ncbi:MAG: DUF4848 domain-containing protein [Tannerellaceae bacterium]|jgi:hypothetical protein|nr:DUF4848 domain-containing protein [Tannerellaceae bacterium]
MEKIKYFVLTGVMSLITISCNDDITPIDEVKAGEGAELGIELLSDGNTIRIKDEATYMGLLDIIASKTEQEKKDFFEKISFKPQCILLNEADEELRMICENSNEQNFAAKYMEYRKKYDEVFMFNETDDEDLSAYSKIINAENRYFANEDGLFYIGDSLVRTPFFNNVAEYLGLTVATRGEVSTLSSINHAFSRQKTRKVGLYISINGERININFTAQKKGIFGWIRYATQYHAKFQLNGGFQFYETAYFGFPFERYVDKDNVKFQIDTKELSGDFSVHFGKVARRPGPLLHPYQTSGTIEVWSRGVPDVDKGVATVSLAN